MLSKLWTLLHSLRVLSTGNFVLIKDKGQSCETFVGKNVSDDRLRILLLNSLRTVVQG
jgi:hypothetical protein